MNTSLLLFIVTILVISCKDCFSKNLNLLILHNSDILSCIEEVSAAGTPCKKQVEKCYGGFARIAHVIKEARRKAKEGMGPEVLYLNAGDALTGKIWFNVHQWKLLADLMNLLQPDALSLGNALDRSTKSIIPFINEAKFPIVSANLNFSNELKLKTGKIMKSVVIELSGTKIGVIGYLTPQSPKNNTLKNVIAAVKREGELLEKQGVKIIIALGHSRFEMDKKIAEEVPLVDLVVGGNLKTLSDGHSFIVHQRSGKKVPVVHTLDCTKYMGCLNITFNYQGDLLTYDEQSLLLDESIPQEKNALDLIEVYKSEVKSLEEEIIGKSLVTLDESKCRYEECNFGNFIADAFVDYITSIYRGESWTDAPIAIINAGYIRSTIEPHFSDGTVTRTDLLEALPYPDTITTIHINGAHLLETLEIGVEGNDSMERKGFIQTSGLRYKINYENPPGKRIEEVYVRCSYCRVPDYEPLENNVTYKIITTGFMSGGGDRHRVIAENAFYKNDLDVSTLDVIVQYWKKMSPIYPEINQRIIDYAGSGVDHLRMASLCFFVVITFGLLKL